MARHLALFDFDGTITNRDSMPVFLKFYKGAIKYYFTLFLLSPLIILTKLRFVNIQVAKNLLFRSFFKDDDLTSLNSKCSEFGNQKMAALLRDQAMKQIHHHKAEGHTIYVVTASAENWVQPFCNALNIELIGTRLELENEKLTGRIDGLNCKGEEKVKRIKQVIDLEEFEEIHAYGDSSGDYEMLKLASKAHYKPFRN